jgi:hypothetical protein
MLQLKRDCYQDDVKDDAIAAKAQRLSGDAKENDPGRSSKGSIADANELWEDEMDEMRSQSTRRSFMMTHWGLYRQGKIRKVRYFDCYPEVLGREQEPEQSTVYEGHVLASSAETAQVLPEHQENR